MEQRYAVNPGQIVGMDTAELRDRFLITDLFVPGQVTLVYTHHDRIVLGGAVPAGAELALTGYPEIRSDYFLEHREVGIINVGDTGTVTADGQVHRLVKGPVSTSAGGQGGDPRRRRRVGRRPVLPLLRAGSRQLPQRARRAGAGHRARTRRPADLQPPHPHPVHPRERRPELPDRDGGDRAPPRFDVEHDAGAHPRPAHRVLPVLRPSRGRPGGAPAGERQETRHLVVGDRQAVISPSWSLHSGVGTAAYSFIWAMAGRTSPSTTWTPPRSPTCAERPS